MNKILFISNLPSDINTRRYKNRNFYSWVLERLNYEKEITSALDINPSEPSRHGIQMRKDEIISKLNKINPFDFPYEPREQDFLKIYDEKNSSDYLTLSFENGEWIETIRWTITDLHELISNGKFELK